MSAPESVAEVLERRIAAAIATADHCPHFLIGQQLHESDSEQCDGLPWCQRCLRLAARSVLEALGKDVDG